MSVLLIALLGLATVLLAILVAKLHPFLALVLAAFVVLVFTPRDCWIQNELAGQTVRVSRVAGARFQCDKRLDESRTYVVLPTGASFTVKQTTSVAATDDELWYEIETADTPHPEATVAVGNTLVTKPSFDAAAGNWQRTHIGTVMKKLSAGLSKTFEKIGLPIAMAAIIGACLLESGAAASLVNWLSRLLGERRTAPTLMISGFVLGVPIFFDTVFYLLLPLAKAFGQNRPTHRLLAVMSIIVGATMAHSLVPPTPGPLLVASQLGVSIGSMMIGGILVGSVTASSGFVYSLWCNRNLDIRLDSPTINQPSSSITVPSTQPQSVPIYLAALPLLFPIVSLGGIEVGRSMGILPKSAQASSSSLNNALDLLADPSFVLMISAFVSILLLRRVANAGSSASIISKAIADAGIILLLTCAGGAFGSALQQLRLADAIASLSSGFITPHGLLLAAFVLTAVIRVAQGSATVAMITAVSIVAPFVQSDALPFHPVYVALAIGCGAKLLPWMNDSGFWQVSTMTGMTVGQTLKTFSAALTLMGCVGIVVTMLGAWLLPFK